MEDSASSLHYYSYVRFHLSSNLYFGVLNLRKEYKYLHVLSYIQ